MHMLFKCISAKCVFVCLSYFGNFFIKTLWHYFYLYLVSMLLSPIRVSLHRTTEKNREHRAEHNTLSTAAAVVSHGFGFAVGVDAF